jgi:hypothetical protein
MKPKKSGINKNSNNIESNSILEELLHGLIGIVFGSITSKAGLSILFTILGIIFFVCPMHDNSKKPVGFLIFASSLILVAIIFLIVRIIEIKKEENRKN